MKNWVRALLPPHATIYDAAQIIDASAINGSDLLLPGNIALIVDQNHTLLGVVTDGDIRRAQMNRIPKDAPVSRIMNTHFTYASQGTPEEEIFQIMKQRGLGQIPLLDSHGKIAGLKLLREVIGSDKRPNWVVLMAGGLGERLGNLTKECPKPLLQIGNKSILEIILNNFIKFGFENFFIAVNYLAEMFQEKFKDGSPWGVKISYLREKEKFGTAGALSLLPSIPRDPIIVINGDVLTKVSLQAVLDFHQRAGGKATMCVREYDFSVPFGVVQTDQFKIIGIDEKPRHRFFVNAGIYVLEPEILSLIPQSTRFDMPVLFEKAIQAGLPTRAFPIREYWIDVGHLDDFHRAQTEIPVVFE